MMQKVNTKTKPTGDSGGAREIRDGAVQNAVAITNAAFKYAMFALVGVTFLAVGLYGNRVYVEEKMQLDSDRAAASATLRGEYCLFFSNRLSPERRAEVHDDAIAATRVPCDKATLELAESYNLQLIRRLLTSYSMCEPGRCWQDLSAKVTGSYIVQVVVLPIAGFIFRGALWTGAKRISGFG